LERLHRALLEYGLVPLIDNSAPTASSQTQNARAIAILFEQGDVHLDTGCGPLDLRKSELLLFKAAQHYKLEIVLFSSRKQPHRYRSIEEPRYSLALLEIKDRHLSASQLVALVCSRTRPSYRILKPPAPPKTLPQPKYPQAVRRTEDRKRSCVRYDHGNDVDAFHRGW
jgi:hypothetical protein